MACGRRFEGRARRPVTRFVLDLEGGKKGLLQNSSDLCASSGKSKIRMTGQNGMVAVSRRKPQVSCGSSASRKRHLHKRGGSGEATQDERE